MARIVILYASQEGQSARIAERIAGVGRQLGHQIEVADIATLGERFSLTGYDGVVLGGSIHYGRYSPSLEHFLRRWRPFLDAIPNAFFSVSLTARRGSERYREKAERFIAKLERRTGWHPQQRCSFAGALLYTRYPIWKRWMLQFISFLSGGDTDASRDYEYTDWDAVDDFAQRFFERMG